MDRKIRILVLLLFLIFWGTFLFLHKIRDLDMVDSFKTSFLMRNLTWQTDFGEDIPYKKWDEIEYNALFSSNAQESIGIDLSMIKQRIDIERILYNDQSIRESELSKFSMSKSGIVKVIGKAKNTSAQDNTSAKTAFIVTNTEEKETVKKIESVVDEESENTGTTTIPSGLRLSATSFNSNIANLLMITGKNLENITAVNIGWTSFHPIFSNNTLHITIDRDTFAAGEYFLFYELRNGQIITPSIKLSFAHSFEKINIANITPNRIKNDQDRLIILQWNGFDKIVSIQLSNNLILKNAEFTPINKQVVGVKIPKWLSPWEYYFNIMDTQSIYELKNMKFVIY